jgi:DNA helicase-2/ATP-dependent DNA helicase PcrA
MQTELLAGADYQTRLGLAHTPSTMQTAVFDFIVNGRGHGVVEAVAGSGKTTTIEWAARLLTCSGLFMAFNRSVVAELQARLKTTEMTAATVHSHGFSAVKNAIGGSDLDPMKYKAPISAIADAARVQGILALGQRNRSRSLTSAELAVIDEDGFPTSQVSKLLDLARLELLDPREDTFAAAVKDLADHHNIDGLEGLGAVVVASLRALMTWGWDNPQTVDFTDMVWLATVNGYAPTRYAWVFVDEAQDLSRAHLALIQRSLLPGGRLLCVGDPKQAIYGFAGADARSFARIIEVTKATVLPLSVCYRCPTSVLEMARDYCPQIEARPGAPEGIVRRLDRSEFLSEAREGDMVLCRRNAPLLGLAFGLIAEGISAAVRGRSIGQGLVKTIRKVGKRSDWAGFLSGLDSWLTAESESVRTRYRDADAAADRIEALDDQVQCIRVILARSAARSVSALVQAVESIFTDGTTSVVLSSIHRAKGLEAKRVAIVESERLGMGRKGSKPWMCEQEENLAYVAYTRAQYELILLNDPPRLDLR